MKKSGALVGTNSTPSDDSVKARPTRNRLQRDLGYDLIGLSAPTMFMPCRLVPWFQARRAGLVHLRQTFVRRSQN
jgi:hypothetical protein